VPEIAVAAQSREGVDYDGSKVTDEEARPDFALGGKRNARHDFDPLLGRNRNEMSEATDRPDSVPDQRMEKPVDGAGPEPLIEDDDAEPRARLQAIAVHVLEKIGECSHPLRAGS
jgi:hypothetical protein